MTMDHNYNEGGIRVPSNSDAPLGGVFSLPGVGGALSRMSQFFGDIAPGENDSAEVRLAKHILRWSAASGWAAVGVMVVFQPGHSAR